MADILSRMCREIEESFSNHPEAILRYISSDNNFTIYSVGDYFKGNVPPNCCMIQATGEYPDLKAKRILTFFNELSNILKGSSTKYKSIMLLINDWQGDVLNEVTNQFGSSITGLVSCHACNVV